MKKKENEASRGSSHNLLTALAAPTLHVCGFVTALHVQCIEGRNYRTTGMLHTIFFTEATACLYM